MRRFAVLAALGLVAAACSGDMPTQPDSMLGPQDALMKNGATGAVVDNTAVDACMKVVPGGNGQAEPRTIYKPMKNGVCPGGFEAGLPACTDNGQDPSTCNCEAAGGTVVTYGGVDHCVGIVVGTG